VQEALLAATTVWQQRGVPANVGGWLFAAACRRLQDRSDAETARRRREQDLAAVRATAAEPDFDDLTAGDDTLRLLFLCCHPALTPPSAIALTLRAVAGLTTAAIARALLSTEATMAQRISRAKETIAGSGQGLSLPDAAAREQRLAAVLHVLYLMFNEGHTATAGDQLARRDLCREAIRLCRLLAELLPGEPEVLGLQALLLLTDARAAARSGPAGELVPLAEQDRSRWDRDAIRNGEALVTAAFRSGRIGSYQLQAAIAALHAEAPSVAATDWPQILQLYDLLLRIADNPVVALNRAVALAMVHGSAAGLLAVDEVAAGGRLGEHFRLAAVRAHLQEMAGDGAAALVSFRAAAAGAENQAERSYLLRQVARLEDSGRPGS
ncbi:MAG: DUF6596 domain-containing protein, partial [Planctomycetota bacterium]